jgi:hypothetical protein
VYSNALPYILVFARVFPCTPAYSWEYTALHGNTREDIKKILE